MAEISTIGVIGAGQMGAGIAQVAAMSGFTTVLWDMDAAALGRGYNSIKSQLERLVEKEKISADASRTAFSRISMAKNVADFSNCDLAIEAIIENVDIKGKLLRELDATLRPTALIGSNTSSISITKLAAVTRRRIKSWEFIS